MGNASDGPSGLRVAPAAERNQGPIASVLGQVLPAHGRVLEIASGTGQHLMHFAARFPALHWQPSDPSDDALHSIAAYRERDGLSNVSAPLQLSAEDHTWNLAPVDAIFCANMIHIAPWSATLGLLRNAAALLPPRGLLVLYGPFKRAGEHTAPSNVAFDAWLHGQDPRWGVRNLEDVDAAAHAHGLHREQLFEMPANNLTVVFTKVST